VFSLQEASTLLGERIRERRARNEAARDQDLAEALARALLLGERVRKILLADQASFYEQRAKPTPTRICRIHTYAYQPPRREQRLIREPTQARFLRATLLVLRRAQSTNSTVAPASRPASQARRSKSAVIRSASRSRSQAKKARLRSRLTRFVTMSSRDSKNSSSSGTRSGLLSRSRMAAFRGEEQSPHCGRRGLGNASFPTFEAWMRLPGREASAWGRSKSSVGFSKTIPIPLRLVAVCWKRDAGQRSRLVPSRRSFVVRWKALRCFDDELGIVPSYSADAPALGVLELEDRRRDAHRRCADDDMEAPSVADDCSDLEHGHRHTPNACAGKESAASPARSIPGSEACPLGGSVSSFRQRATATDVDMSTADVWIFVTRKASRTLRRPGRGTG